MVEVHYKIKKELETIAVFMKFFCHNRWHSRKLECIFFLCQSKLCWLTSFLSSSPLNITHLRSNMTNLRTECLQSLCRVCGNKLKRSKDQWKSNYRCEDYREMLWEKFDLETEKDDASIHPLRFCNACYLSTSKTHASLVWEPHGEESCKTCFHGM